MNVRQDSATRPRATSALRLVSEVGVVVWRHLVQIRHNPEQILELAVQPVLFVFLFGVVLAGQMGGAGGDYLAFVVPGLVVQSIVLVTARTMTGLHADVHTGLMQRVHALPVSRFAPLAGRILADFVMLLWSLLVLLATAVVIGYRATIAPATAIAALGVIALFYAALEWAAALGALTVRSPESVQALGLAAMLPLVILSGAFVDIGTVPEWLQPVMEWNPVSLAVAALRGLIAGQDVTEPLTRLVTVCAVMLAVFVPLSVRAFARER